MSDQTEAGVIAALLKRFESQRLPRALDLQKKVSSGEVLSDEDIDFLETVMTDSRKIMSIANDNPEYQGLASKAIHLYGDIIKTSLENQEKTS